MLREHIQSGDAIGQQVQTLMRNGRLVSDDLVNDLVVQRTADPDCAHGFILDGYPRTIQQAQAMDEHLRRSGFREVVIHLEVDYNKLVARMSGRRQCPLCGTLYSLSSNPPRQPNICDKDGTALITREDDREEVIRERLNAYERQTRPVLDYFRQSGQPFFEVSGSEGSPQEIVGKICGLLGGAC